MADPSTDDPGVLARLARPIREFLVTESAGGLLLVIAAAIALVWVNSPFGNSYEDFWSRRLSLGVDEGPLSLTLRGWINDGLMAIFFFIAGLEIKRELVKGELSDRRRAALPAVAALGGMVVPALVYVAFNFGGDGLRGWGIPMATDIAFAMGLLSLFGDRVPSSLKVFLLSLAIVDDIGAILVIAIFYTDTLNLEWLAVSLLLLATMRWLYARGIASFPLHAALAVTAWLFVLESGIHATIAGVAVALVTPVRPTDPVARRTQDEEDDLATSVGDRLLRALHPYSSYIVVPLFGLANAGIPLGASALADASGSRVALGVFFGLVVGKLVGIAAAAWMASRVGLASLPPDTSWAMLVAVAAMGGVGFTVSLFIGNLAFPDHRNDAVRVGILLGSLVAAGLGSLLLLSSTRRTT